MKFDDISDSDFYREAVSKVRDELKLDQEISARKHAHMHTHLGSYVDTESPPQTLLMNGQCHSCALMNTSLQQTQVSMCAVSPRAVRVFGTCS